MKRLANIILILMLLMAMAVESKEAYSHVVRICTEEYVSYIGLSDGAVYGIELTQTRTGTGFAVGEIGEPVKYFANNRHVVEPDSEDSTGALNVNGSAVNVAAVHETRPYAVFTNGEEKMIANTVAMSDRCDPAIISLNEATELRKPSIIAPMSIEDLITNPPYPQMNRHTAPRSQPGGYIPTQPGSEPDINAIEAEDEVTICCCPSWTRWITSTPIRKPCIAISARIISSSARAASIPRESPPA